MRARLAKVFLALALVFGGAMMTNIVIVADTATAAGCSTPGVAFFNLRTWYEGLTYERTVTDATGNIKISCEIQTPVAFEGGVNPPSGNEVEMNTFVWRIVFNCIDILLTLIAYAAVLFVLVGGFHILFSSGDPGKVSKGKMTITNAFLSVVIAVCASGLVRFVNDALFGTGTSPMVNIAANGTATVTGGADTTNIWPNAISSFLFMIGIGTVAMIVWGGIKLSMSAGDPQAQAKAKNTIVFAAIGMVVAILAGVLVQIVFRAVDSGVTN